MAGGGGSPAKAILYAFLANLGLALAKLAAALYTASGSMMAEAIHSFADTGNQVLLYIGLKSSEKPADAVHPLGYGKLSYFWSFIVALMLFSVGGLYSIYEGVHKLTEPGELRQLWVGLVVLGFGIVIEALSFYGAIIEARKMAGEKSLVQWFRHTRNAEVVVVLGEDFAAIVGLVIAFCFLSVTWYTGNPLYDALGSISIGIVLILVALFLAIRLQGLIVGKSAEPDLQNLLDELIAADPYVDRVLNTITVHMGAKIMLAAKIEMRGDITVDFAVDVINQMERNIKAAHPEIGWCFIEPDNQD